MTTDAAEPSAGSVALAGGPRGIRCNVVAPGLIDTPLGRAATQRRATDKRSPSEEGSRSKDGRFR